MTIYIVTELHTPIDDAPYVYATPFADEKSAQKHMNQRIAEIFDEWVNEAEMDPSLFTEETYLDCSTLSDGCGTYVDWQIKEEEVR